MSERKRIGLMVVLLLSVSLLIASLSAVQRQGKGDYSYLDGSTFSPGPRGLKALWLTLRAEGVPVARMMTPTPAASTGDVLVLAGPCATPLDEDTVRRLVAWVRAGNSLIYLPSQAALAANPAADYVLHRALGCSVWAEGPPDMPQQDGRPLTWTQWKRWAREGFTLKVTGAPEYVRGVTTLAVEGRCDAMPVRPNWHVTVGRDAGGVGVDLRFVLRQRLGAGSVTVVAVPSTFTNRLLDQADNYRLVSNVIALSRGGGRILFDEYAHGFTARPERERGGVPLAFLALLGQAALWSAAFVLAKGRRLGPPIEVREENRQGKLEFAASMGRLYEQADARLHALARLYGEITERAGFRDAEGVAFDVLVARVADRSLLPREEVAGVLADADEAIRTGRVTAARFVAVAGGMGRISARMTRDF